MCKLIGPLICLIQGDITKSTHSYIYIKVWFPDNFWFSTEYSWVGRCLQSLHSTVRCAYKSELFSLADWKVEIPELLIKGEHKAEIDKTDNSNQGEEKHQQSKRKPQHFPIKALEPELRKWHTCMVNPLHSLLTCFYLSIQYSFIVSFLSSWLFLFSRSVILFRLSEFRYYSVPHGITTILLRIWSHGHCWLGL